MHSLSILKSHARLALFERTAQATCVVLFILVQLMSAAFGSTPPNVVHPTDKSNLSLPNAFNEGLIHSPRTASVRLQLGITKSQLIPATELPILNFQQGDLSQYKATGRQLQIEIKAQENIVTQEVVTAYQRMVGAKRKIEIYQDRLLARTLEIVRPARLGYEIANSNINDVLLAQQSAIAVKTEYLEAVAAYQIAFKDLEQSIGTPLQ